MAKYDLEFKLKVVEEYLSGSLGLNSLAKKYHLKSSNNIRKWVNAYETLGVEGLKRSRKSNSYTVDFKIKAITMYESSEKSYQAVANELGLNNPSLIAQWRQEYHEHGIEGLSRRKGRPPLSKEDPGKKNSQAPSKSEKITDLEQANKRIEELEYELKMQTIKNEYLEMLRSLRLQKAMKTKQESSTSSVDKEDLH